MVSCFPEQLFGRRGGGQWTIGIFISFNLVDCLVTNYMLLFLNMIFERHMLLLKKTIIKESVIGQVF